jgi:hypothetical protein
MEISADQRKQPADLAQNRCYFEERKLVSSKKIQKRVKEKRVGLEYWSVDGSP